MSRLKILVATTSYPIRAGSFEGVFVQRLAEALSGTASVTVLAPRAPGLPSLERVGGLAIRRFAYAPRCLETLAYGEGGIPERLRENRLRLALVPPFLASLALHLGILGRDADVIHANWALTGLAAAVAHRLHRRPVVVTLRGSDMALGNRGGLFRWLLHQGCSRADAVTSVNEAFTGEESGGRIRMIPNGVDLRPELAPPGERPGPFRFLFVGTLIPRKDAATLLAAFAQLPGSPSSELVVVGDGAERERLEARARQLEVADRVRFTGLLSHDDALEEIGHADCLVLPSRWEGRPNVLLEAMAAGRPFVASDIPGCRELTRVDGNGLIHRVGDPADLADKMRRFLEEPGLAARLGSAGRAFLVEQGLTWEHCAARYLDVFHEVRKGTCAGSTGC